MDILASIRKDYKKAALEINNYAKLSFDDLANGYCDAVDNKESVNQNRYFAAMMLRIMPNIYNFYKKWKGIYPLEEVHDKAVNAILYQCQPKYRAWRRPGSTLNAQQCMNQTLSCRFAELPYESNLDLHKANYNTMSFNMPLNEEEGKATLSEILPDEESSDKIKDIMSGARSLVQSYINEGKPIEGIILDTIAYNDTTKKTKETKTKISDSGETMKFSEYSSEFWEFKAVQILNDLPEDYAESFQHKYKISDEVLEVAIKAIQNATNQKLYKYLRATLSDCRKNPERFSLLYN